MNWPHAHLIVNLVPLVTAVIGFFVLLVGATRRNDTLVGTGLSLYVFVGIAVGVTYLTGQQAEELIEHLPGISEELIEHHEEAAILALVGGLALGLVGVVGLALLHRAPRIRAWVQGGGLLLGAVTVFVIGWTANKGGKINHPEIRPGFEAPTAVGQGPEVEEGEPGASEASAGR